MKNISHKKKYLYIFFAILLAIILGVAGTFLWQKKSAKASITSTLQKAPHKEQTVFTEIKDRGCSSKDEGYVAERLSCYYRGVALQKAHDGLASITDLQNLLINDGWKLKDREVDIAGYTSKGDDLVLSYLKENSEAKIFYRKANNLQELEKIRNEITQFYGASLPIASDTSAEIVGLYISTRYWSMLTL